MGQGIAGETELTSEDIDKLIQDFHVKDATKLKGDHPLKNKLADLFNKAWKVHLVDAKEILYNWDRYENKTPTDHWNASKSDDQSKNLYSSGLIPRMIDRFVAILMGRKPTPNISGVMREDFVETFEYMMQNNQLSDRTIAWVSENNGLETDEFGNIVGINRKGLQEWFMKLSRYALETYMNSTDVRLYQKLQLLIKNGCLARKSWWKLHTGMKNGQPKTYISNVPPLNILDDPIATTREGREVVFHVNPMLISRAEKEFNIEPDTLVPEPSQSEMNKLMAGKKCETDKEFYSVRRVLVVEAWVKDTSTVEGIPAFPAGRIITFIPNQDTNNETIMIVDDRPNERSDMEFQELVLKPISETDGKPMIRDLVYLANVLDATVQQIVQNHRITGNNMIVYEEGALVNADNLTNVIADKVEVTHMNGFELRSGKPMDLTGLSFANFMKAEARDTSGIQEAGEGKNPSDVRSGAALKVLQTQIDRLFGPASEAIEDLLNRVFEIIGEDMFWMFRQGDRIRYGENSKEVYYLEFDLGLFIESFDFYIAPGTMLPRDELSYTNMLIALAGMPSGDGQTQLIPPEILLRELKIDNIEEIEQITGQKKQMQQQLQQMGEQMEQMGQTIEGMQQEGQQLFEENQNLKTKAAGSETQGMVKLISEEMKQNNLNMRQMMDSQTEILNTKITGKFKLLQEEIKQRNKVPART